MSYQRPPTDRHERRRVDAMLQQQAVRRVLSPMRLTNVYWKMRYARRQLIVATTRRYRRKHVAEATTSSSAEIMTRFDCRQHRERDTQAKLGLPARTS